MCHLGMLHYDVIGTLENIKAFWETIEIRIGVPAGTLVEPAGSASRMVNVNVTEKKSEGPIHSKHYDCELLQVLHQIYRSDFEWLAKFGPPSALGYLCSVNPACFPKECSHIHAVMQAGASSKHES